MPIPLPLDSQFRIATSREIRSWSFGRVRKTRDASATFSDNVAGTLHDQRIFGPIHDFKCACGKYEGASYKGMICDRCGVKIALKTVRRSRFGHVEFPESVPHPFSSNTALDCFPVIPGAFLESRRGRELLQIYDKLVEVAGSRPASQIAERVGALTDFLIPVATIVDDWGLECAETLARGLALAPHETAASAYCEQCGYLTAGLEGDQCPGCGCTMP